MGSMQHREGPLDAHAGTGMNWRSLPLGVRLLLVNHLAGNIAFYMLIPFLAEYLQDDLGLSAAVVGVVLAVRNLSQQGLFLIGGSAADRLGARGVIIVGAAIRAVGLAMFAAGDSLPIVLTAAGLTGFAGALFNPAVRAYIAGESGHHRAEAFAWFNVFGNVGVTAGPLLGVGLAKFGFRMTAVAAASIFALLTLAQLVLLPARRVELSPTGVLRDWLLVIRDRHFRAFTLALMGMFALQMQVYFVLTLQARQATGAALAATAVAALFISQTLVSILLQVRVTRACKRVFERAEAMALGLGVMGAAFLVPPTALLLTGPGPAPGFLVPGTLGPVLVAAILLALGIMIAQPFVNELIPEFGPARLTGTYFGVFYMVAGVVTFSTNVVLGMVVDALGDALAWEPAILCAGIGFASAAAVLLLHRNGWVPAPPVAAVMGSDESYAQ